MITCSNPRFTRGRRTVATAVTALAGAAALAGTPALAGVADAAAPHTVGAGRVLQTDVRVNGFRSHRVEQEYFGAHYRYLLISQYGKHHRLDYRSWQKDALGAREHAVKQVQITPDRKRYTVRTSGIAPLPAVSFGVLSTPAQVAQAIRDGAVHEEGLGMRDGQRVRLLTIPSTQRVRSSLLWVNPITLAPVASTAAYVSTNAKTRDVSARWETVGDQTVKTLESAPKVPATYKVTHS